jgi:hypothetical protein
MSAGVDFSAAKVWNRPWRFLPRLPPLPLAIVAAWSDPSTSGIPHPTHLGHL